MKNINESNKQNNSTDWREKFKDEFCEDDRETIIGYEEAWRIIRFIEEEVISSELQRVTKQEEDRWLHQSTNEHDRRIREDERKRVLEEVEGIIGQIEKKYFPFDDGEPAHELLSKINILKQK